MARRRMVLRTIDPLSVLKFGAVANLAVAAIGVVAGAVVIRAVASAGIIDQVCGIAEDIGFLSCDLSPARWTRQLVLLGLVWAVVQTVLLVLLAVLHNLIAGITGGLTVVMEVEGPAGPRGAGAAGGAGAAPAGLPGAAAGGPPPVVARPGPAPADAETTTVEAVDALEAIVPPRAPRTAPGGSTGGGRLFGGRGDGSGPA